MSFVARLSSFDDDIDFRRVWRWGIAISTVLVVTSALAIGVRGLNLGIDFEGGTSWDVPARDLSVGDTRDALRPIGHANAKIITVGRGDARIVRVQTEPTDDAAQAEITAALVEAADVPEEELSISTVGPSWGDQITEKAQRALVFFFIAITAYIAIRLEWKMAIGALVSVAHDLLISVGFYAAFQIEITPATVIAFMTILGYSLYDTIVVFDRVRENAAGLTSTSRRTYTDTMSLSLNQVLMRSINTTITSMLPVGGLLVVGSVFLGAVALQEFALALAVGLVVGAYSSIMVAAPLVCAIKEREPRNRELRRRVEAIRGPISGAPAAPAPAPVASAAGANVRSAGDTSRSASEAAGQVQPTPKRRPAATTTVQAIPPRPRKKGRRR